MWVVQTSESPIEERVVAVVVKSFEVDLEPAKLEACEPHVACKGLSHGLPGSGSRQHSRSLSCSCLWSLCSHSLHLLLPVSAFGGNPERPRTLVQCSAAQHSTSCEGEHPCHAACSS